MRYVSYVSVLALVAAFVMFLSAPSTAEVKLAGGGSISGKVVDADGNPVADAMVRVLPAKERPAGDKVKKNSASNLVEDGAKPDKPEKPNRPQAVAEGKTDAKGEFKLEGIPAGTYTVIAGVKEKALMGHANVTVAEGQDASVEIKLAPKGDRPAGKERGDKPEKQEKHKKD